MSLSTIFYSQLATIAGLPVIPETGVPLPRGKCWEVLAEDTEAGLYLCHYKAENRKAIIESPQFTQVEKEALLNLRGVVVHLAASRIVCRSFGHTPILTADELKEGKMRLVDQLGITYEVEPEKAQFQITFEGTLLRRYKVEGKVYSSTHKRIDTKNSRYGTSPPFPQLYETLGGPTDDALFDPTMETSNFCHIFLISSPYLLSQTKMNIGEGVLVYLGIVKLGEPSEKDEEWRKQWMASTRWASSPAGTFEKKEEEALSKTPPLYISPTFDYKAANQVLTTGFSPLATAEVLKMDARLRPGEAVICSYNGSMFKIASQAYHWRAAIAGNDPNPLHRFYQLVDFSYLAERKVGPRGGGPLFNGDDTRAYTYTELFPHLGTPTGNQLREMGAGPLWQPPVDVEKESLEKLNAWPEDHSYDPRDLRLRNIAFCFTLAVPLHLQEAVGAYYNDLNDGRDRLITYLATQFPHFLKMLREKKLGEIKQFGNGKDFTGAGKSMKRLIEEAEKNLKEHRKQGNRSSTFQIVSNSLRNLLRKEYGRTLYALVQATRKYREAEKVEPVPIEKVEPVPIEKVEPVPIEKVEPVPTEKAGKGKPQWIVKK